MDGCAIFSVILVVGMVALVISVFVTRQKTEDRLRQPHQEMIAAKLDPVVLRDVVSEIKSLKQIKFPEISARIYESALDVLSANSNSPIAKQLVLDVGRWHHGMCRRDGVPTVYDEQAIQNDIIVRSKHS